MAVNILSSLQGDGHCYRHREKYYLVPELHVPNSSDSDGDMDNEDHSQAVQREKERPLVFRC